MRWLFHIVSEGTLLSGSYRPPSLKRERFIHASYKDQVEASARAHFPADARLQVLQIDPRRLDAPVRSDPTPRGPMPHIYGAVASDAIRAVLRMDEVAAAPDEVKETRFAFVAFDGMTLLDLVGVHDPLSRIASMGFDPSASFEIVGATGSRVWASGGAELVVEKVRPPLDAFDVVIVPGGPGARALTRDRTVIDWLGAFPSNRLMASVCTGALLLGAAGRLMEKRATTHHKSMGLLETYGAVPTKGRVIDEGQTVTAGGVTCALDLGVLLLRRYVDDAAVRKIVEQMELLD